MKLLIVTKHIGKDIPNGTWEFAYKFGKYASELINVAIVTFKPKEMPQLPD